jgi:hypothetical protein
MASTYTLGIMDRNAPYYGDNAAIPDGKKTDRPPHGVAFKQAPEATGKEKKTELGL